jgi:hypothetical protein
MSRPVTLRLPDDSVTELRRIATRERRSVSEVGARFIEEGIRQMRFPHIEFRSVGGERLACAKGGQPVWQVIFVARDYGMNVDQTAAHLDLTSDQVKSAIAYYDAYPEEIDCALEENDMSFEELKRMLPHIERVTVDLRENTRA